MSEGSFIERFKTAAALMMLLLLVMWAVEILNMVTGHRLSRLGAIHPRTFSGLIGMVTAPFLHFGLFHLLLNSLPFAVLGGLICMQDKKLFFEVSLLIMIMAGIGTWLFARSAAHAGASSLIFGYFGFLLASGWYAKDVQSILIAIAVLFYYGGMIFGVLPIRAFISWEGHLFGLLAGIAASRLDLMNR